MYFCVWDHTDYTGNIMILYQILHACKCDMLFLWSVKLFLGGLDGIDALPLLQLRFASGRGTCLLISSRDQ